MGRKGSVITIILLLASAALALFLGILDSIEAAPPGACTDSCVALHGSSFGRVCGIPVGYPACAALVIIAVLFLRGRARLASLGLASMVGAESYMTVIQLVHMELLCQWCMLFFGFLLLSAIASLAANRKQPGVGKQSMAAMTLSFLAIHFWVFPPAIDLKPTVFKERGRAQVEIFASPSCGHCEEAIENLRVYCQLSGGASLVLRPVGLSKKDRRESVEWVCRSLFENTSDAAQRLAEKIVFKNERDVKKINSGRLSVPVIVVDIDGQRREFQGWSPGVQESVLSLLAAKDSVSGAGIFGSRAGNLAIRGPSETMCGGESEILTPASGQCSAVN